MLEWGLWEERLKIGAGAFQMTKMHDSTAKIDRGTRMVIPSKIWRLLTWPTFLGRVTRGWHAACRHPAPLHNYWVANSDFNPYFYIFLFLSSASPAQSDPRLMAIGSSEKRTEWEISGARIFYSFDYHSCDSHHRPSRPSLCHLSVIRTVKNPLFSRKHTFEE